MFTLVLLVGIGAGPADPPPVVQGTCANGTCTTGLAVVTPRVVMTRQVFKERTRIFTRGDGPVRRFFSRFRSGC